MLGCQPTPATRNATPISTSVNLPALWLAIAVSLAITVVVMLADPAENRRRGWIVAGLLAAVLFGLAFVDLARTPQREAPFSAPLLGVLLPVLGATAMARATRRLPTWSRWGLVLAIAFVLLLGGLLVGAAVVPRYL